jgi:hypothetical protein
VFVLCSCFGVSHADICLVLAQMGGYFSSFFEQVAQVFGQSESSRFLMLGLDNAGKTTVLYAMKLGEVVSTAPTVGFNVEEVTISGITMSVWDIGGAQNSSIGCLGCKRFSCFVCLFVFGLRGFCFFVFFFFFQDKQKCGNCGDTITKEPLR